MQVEKPPKKFKFRHFFWLLVIPAVWWVVHIVPLDQIFEQVAQLQGWQLLLLLGVNTLLLILFSLRWWLILQAMGSKVTVRTAVAYHLVGFGVSYFTIGPQVGGEPLQVILLANNQNVPTATALSSVFLDKVFEILTNFTFIALSAGVILLGGRTNVYQMNGWWLLALILLTLPGLHLLALRRGILPVSRLLQKVPGFHRFHRIQELVMQSERQISRLLIEQPAVVAKLAIISGLGWAVMVGEYLLMLKFLEINLTLPQGLTTFVASQLAFLTPVPGGLGALEVSQVYSLSNFGISAAAGLGVALLIRARDVIFGLLGVGIAGISTRNIAFFNQKSIVHNE